jgi:hypothetical protein
VRAWLGLALACSLLPAWAQSPPAAHKKAARPASVKAHKAHDARKAQKVHRQATPEQVRRFNALQKKQDAKR